MENLKKGPELHRRPFLKRLWALLGLTILGEFLWVFFSFLKSPPKKNALVSSVPKIHAGTTQTFAPGSVTAFVTGHFYLVCLEDGGFLALSGQCTHLGCALAWDDKKQQFICPCHASVFDIKGNVISSPAPRALDLFSLTITNNRITVDTGQRQKRNRFNSNQAVYPESVTHEKNGPT